MKMKYSMCIIGLCSSFFLVAAEAFIVSNQAASYYLAQIKQSKKNDPQEIELVPIKRKNSSQPPCTIEQVSKQSSLKNTQPFK